MLTIKGRHLHTLRWLWHANKTQLPYPIHIADGEVHPVISKLLLDPTTFPNINYTYNTYKDLSIRDYYFKKMDSLSRLRTPYVMLVDNDDFVLPSGIEKSIDFLERNKEYICSQARIAGFKINKSQSILPQILSRKIEWSPKYISNEWYEPMDFKSLSSVERILSIISNPRSIHYSIYRTSNLLSICEEIFKFNPSFYFCESYLSIRTASMGMIHSSPGFFSYIRQQDSSQFLGYYKDAVDAFLRSTFASDFRIMCTELIKTLPSIPNSEREKALEDIFITYSDQLRKTLSHSNLKFRFPYLKVLIHTPLYKLIKRMKSLITRKPTHLRNIYRYLKSTEISSALLNSQISELEQISDTLKTNSFLEFVTDYANELIKK